MTEADRGERDATARKGPRVKGCRLPPAGKGREMDSPGSLQKEPALLIPKL